MNDDAFDGLPSMLDFSRFRARRTRTRLLVLLDALVVAIERRDLESVWSVLDDSDAIRAFPAGLREEALVITALPRTSFRAPVRLYQYYHTLSQLGDEPLEEGGDPDQLVMPLRSPERSGEAAAKRQPSDFATLPWRQSKP